MRGGAFSSVKSKVSVCASGRYWVLFLSDLRSRGGEEDGEGEG